MIGRVRLAACVAVLSAICGCGAEPDHPGVVFLGAADYTTGRDAQLLMIPVKHTGNTDAAATVAFSTVDGTARAGTDFGARSGTLKWDAGDAADKVIAIPIYDVAVADADKMFALNLTQVTGSVLGVGHATVRIGKALGPAVHVHGNHLVDASGNLLQLRGVNTGSLGGMYALSNRSPDDPWMGNKPDWSKMKAWHVNAVRITLNEASLLGLTTYDPIDNTAWPADAPRTIGMPRQADPGGNYQSSLVQAVDEATGAGMIVILDLHMNAPDDLLPGFRTKVPISPGVAAYMQQPMADRDHSKDFWRWIATTFKSYPNVIFDLFNEPYFFNFAPGRHDAESNWRQLRDGTTVPFYNTGGAGANNDDPTGDPYARSRNPGVINHSWQAIGMQEMLDAVREAGASNVVMIGGVGYAGEMSLWLKYRPMDPSQQLAASWHAYQDPKDDSKPAWGKKQFGYVAEIARQFPVIIGELGGRSGAGSKGAPWASRVLPWADRLGISYLAWSWDPWNSADNDLIKNRDGVPSDGYGEYVQQHLACVADGNLDCR